MISTKPWVVAVELKKVLGFTLIAAREGLKLDLEEG